MILMFNNDVFTAATEGARMLADQAAKARTSVQIASLDGSNTNWTKLSQPCLLLVNRGETRRVSGLELDALILACHQDAVFSVGQQS